MAWPERAIGTVGKDYRPRSNLSPAMRFSLAPDGKSINVLTSDRLTDMGGGATFYSALVEVEKA